MKRPTPPAAHAPKTAYADPLAEVLRPGQSVELLKELHILTRDGKLNQDSRRKLKQVYHLCHFIEPLLDEVLGRQDTLTLADSSVRIAICPWTAVSDYYSTSGDITQAVLETFRERGIHIPFPQREVRLLGNA